MKELIKKIVFAILFRMTIVRHRLNYAKKDLNDKSANIAFKKCSNEQYHRIKQFWGRYNISPNLKWFDFFNTISLDAHKIEYYIPHDIFYSKIDIALSDSNAARYIDDKNLYDLVFYDIDQPKTICRIEDGVLLNENYKFITVDEAVKLCQESGTVIIKPSVNSEGGSGIRFWSKKEDGEDVLMSILREKGHYIISSVVSQSKTLKQIHEASLNTIRIITLVHNNAVHILSHTLRMGVNGAKVDNAASGGIFCGIESSGKLKDVAYDSLGNVYNEHPQSGRFDNITIPNFEKCKDLVKGCAPRLSRISRLCSWDICLNENDQPMLIEVNMSFGDVQLHQIPNGPIFGEMTPEILDSIFKK